MIVSPMARECAVMIETELTLPISIAFPTSAAATAEPLLALVGLLSASSDCAMLRLSLDTLGMTKREAKDE
jgi:hypothetical protein